MTSRTSWKDPELQSVIAGLKSRYKQTYLDEQAFMDRNTAWLPPPVHGEFTIAVCSDLHYASKHCLPGAIEDWFGWARAQGATMGISAGDNVAGCYSFLDYELTAHGVKEQAYLAAELWPKAHDFHWYFIDGNHDYTHESKSGYAFGDTLVDVAARIGRTDFHYLGPRNATLALHHTKDKPPVRVELWHPGGGAANPTGPMIKKIDSYGVANQPHILIVGHYHKAAEVMHREVHAIAGGTFEGKGSEFSKRLTGGPAIGGWVIKFGCTEDGTIRHWETMFRGYPDAPVLVNVPLH